MPDRYTDLIERLSYAREGSRSLDADIAQAIGNTVEIVRVPDDHPIFAAGGGLEFMVRPDGTLTGIPPYTTSLDAALTLVPEGLQWTIGDRQTPETTPWARVGNPLHGADTVAPTVALALCIASLKALQSMEVGNG